jgi:serine/threonine-protein kinase
MAIDDGSTVSATSQSPASLPIGTKIGPYEIVSLIGAGGMGVVYRARDSRLGRDVAIKLIPAARQDAAALKHFEIEARATGSINHPNIISVYDVGTGEYGPWLVAELLDGENLRAVLGGPLPLKRALDYALQLANGLAAAHDRGVVHRDLKPENLFVTRDGVLKILDFGIAKFLADDEHPTQTGKIIGTLAYMSPEQRAGGAIDQRVDIYAFGAILHELLTGQRAPQNGARALPASVPKAPARLVQDCLQEKPKDRPESAHDLVARLHRFSIERPRAAKSSRVASIAVLSFADMSPEKDQEFFSDGIAEEILNALAQVPRIRVTGRTSSFSFKGKNEDLRAIGEKLGVGTVLEGSVRKERNRVRVTAQVVKVADGFQLWSQTYDRELTSIFAVQDEIAKAVVEALRVKLLPGKVLPLNRKHRTPSPEAFQEYLLGKQFFNRNSRDGFQRAVEAYERALTLDSRYAPAWAGLSLAAYYLADWAETPAALEEEHRRAMEAAERAVALDPEFAEGYSARGFQRRAQFWDWPGAQADFERALALNPNDAVALKEYGEVLASLGRLRESLTILRKAAAIDPISTRIWMAVGRVQKGAGEIQLAREAIHRALQIAPESYSGPYHLATTWLLEGQPDAALAALKQSPAIPVRLLATAMAEHDLGHEEASRDALERVIAHYAHLQAFQIAEVFAWIGENDPAFDWLERARAQHDGGVTFVKYSPMLRSLRSDPRYAAFLKKVDLPLD